MVSFPCHVHRRPSSLTDPSLPPTSLPYRPSSIVHLPLALVPVPALTPKVLTGPRRIARGAQVACAVRWREEGVMSTLRGTKRSPTCRRGGIWHGWCGSGSRDWDGFFSIRADVSKDTCGQEPRSRLSWRASGQYGTRSIALKI